MKSSVANALEENPDLSFSWWSKRQSFAHSRMLGQQTTFYVLPKVLLFIFKQWLYSRLWALSGSCLAESGGQLSR
jgi:hypothetical protein